MDYTQRFLRDETDYAAIRRLIAGSYKLAAPHAYMLLGDLDWWRALLGEPDKYMPGIPLWFAGATLVGFYDRFYEWHKGYPSQGEGAT